MTTEFNPNEEVTLIVHSHGIWCSYENQTLFIKVLQDEFDLHSRNVVVHAAQCNTHHTTEGILIGGERLAQEIYDEIQKIPPSFRQGGKKVNLAVIGHSMGGIYLRAMLPFLLKHPGVRENVNFKCFMTLDSPHLGSYFYYLKNIGFNYLGGQSGRDLGFFTDLMFTLTDAEHMDALRMFEHRTLVAVCWGDTLVPFCSASGRLVNPYKAPISYYAAYFAGFFKSFPPAKFALRGYSGFSKAQAEKLGMDAALACDVPSPEKEMEATSQKFTHEKKHWLCCNEGAVNTYEPIFEAFCSPKKREDDPFPEEHFWKRLDLSFGPPDRMGLCVHEMVIGKKQREIDIPACKEAMNLFAKIVEQDTK